MKINEVNIDAKDLNYDISHSIPEFDVLEYLKKFDEHNKHNNKEIELWLIDNNNICYQRLIDGNNISYLSNEKLSDYINLDLINSTNPDDIIYHNNDKLFHLYSFENPIPAKVNGTQIHLTHFAMGIKPKKLIELYLTGINDCANGYLLDETKTIIYNNTGYEAFILSNPQSIINNLSNLTYIPGYTYENFTSGLEQKKTAISKVKITDGNKSGEYYITMAQFNVHTIVEPVIEWYVAAIIDSNKLNYWSRSNMIKIFVTISIIIITLGGFMIGNMYINLKYSNRIKAERLKSKLNEEAANKASAESQAKSAFLSNMSHDIRTPMNAITGYTALAQAHIDEKKKVAQYLEKITCSSNHLLSLINDVLDMSRIEAGKTEITNKPMNIITVSDNCLSIVGGQLLGRDLKLSHVYQVNHPYVLGDSLHLRQIYLNILGNAVKFTPDGGQITLRVLEISSRIQDYATFKIIFEDNGCGMSEEFLEKIWDAFTQEDEGSRTNYKGTGLGMAIVKNLVELMGGTIAVESQKNKGTKFTIELSLPQTDEKPEMINGLPQHQDKSLEGFKVLLAEDNDMNADIAIEILEEQGLILTRAENGQVAVDLFRNSEPGTFDVILMDIIMPVMNGIDATKAIRALDREDAHTIPILAMTANAYTEDVERSLNAGMNAHLTKPVNFPALLKELQKFDKRTK